MGSDVSSPLEVDLDEEGDNTTDPEVDNSNDFVDILDILDGRTDGGTNDVGLANVVQPGPGKDDDAEAEESEEDEDEDEDEPSCSADEDIDPDALEGLEKFVSSLEMSKKRRGDSDITNTSLPRKKRFVEEKTAVGEEREFAAPPSGSSNYGAQRIILNFTRPTASIK